MAKKAKKVRCKKTEEMLPPPCAQEAMISAARVAQRLQMRMDWEAAREAAAEERQRIEAILAALQLRLF